MYFFFFMVQVYWISPPLYRYRTRKLICTCLDLLYVLFLCLEWFGLDNVGMFIFALDDVHN